MQGDINRMGASRKAKKVSAPGTSLNMKGKISQSASSNTKSSDTKSAASVQRSVKENTKSPAGKRDLDIEQQKATPQETPGKKAKRGAISTSSTTPTATAAMSPVRRSSRAPVPSSRFKDMEMSTSNRKRSLASSQSEESDGDVQPSAKRNRKNSDKSPKDASDLEEQMKTTSNEIEKEELESVAVTKPKPEEEGKTVDSLVDGLGSQEAQIDRKEEMSEKGDCNATKEVTVEISSSTDIPATVMPVEVAYPSEAKVTETEEEQNNVEEVGTFESTSSVPEGMVVEEMVHTYMDEKDVIVVKRPEDEMSSPSPLTPPLTEGDEEAKKSSPSSEITITSQEVTLEEKDGQTVAIIKVPSNFGSNECISSVADKPSSPDTSKEKISPAVTKTSPVNKNRHGYILNKTSEEQTAVSLPGHDSNAVVNVSLDRATLKSVLKPKADAPASKTPVKTYGRVLKQEPSVGAMVIKSPRHSSLSETQGNASNIIIQNVGTNQPYSLLPQTIKAVSQAEGKTYSLLAPPSELKQILKGMSEKKPVVQATKSADSAVQLPDVSSASQKVIIITHPSASESVAETTAAATDTSGDADPGIMATSEDREQENIEEISQVETTVSSSVTVTTIDDKEIVETSGQVQAMDENLSDKESATELVDSSLTLKSEEYVIDTQSTDSQKIGNETSEEKSTAEAPKQLEEISPGTDKVDDSSDEPKALKSQQIEVITRDDDSKSEIIETTSDKLPMEEIVVTSTESPVIKVESQEEGVSNPSVNVLSTALAEAEKSHSSGALKPQRIKLIENGVVYELEIFPEGEGKISQEIKGDGEAVTVKQEVADEGEISAPDQDGQKLSSGTQTFYSQKRGRPKSSDDADETEPPVHKLTTIVQEGDQKKHYYYVSVVPGKTLVGKYRQALHPALPGCMVNKLGEYCCKECDYKTDKKANFYKHRRLHTGAKPHLCPVCKYQARTSSNLKRHMGIHDDIREFKCTQCPMSFRQKIHLERHVRYRHEEKRVKCPMCDYVCANEQPDLKMHIKRKHTQESGKTFSCPECKLVVGSRRDLKQHLKFHKDGPELKLFCKECSFVTDCKSRLQRHLVVHSNVKPFQCGVCDYKATQKEHVLRHLRSQHKIEVNKPKRPWKKQIKSDLVDPIQGNTRGDFTCGDKIFACNHCIMRFAKLINLYKHLHTQHSDIMPTETGGNFYCVVCEFSTSSKKNLLVHMRRHNMTDQTPPTHVYSCVLCRYVNPRRRNLFQHMRKKHNIDISSQVDLATMKEEEVNAVQEGVKVTELIQTEEGVYTQGSSGEIASAATVEATDGNVRVVGGDLAAVANMIKIEDLTRTQGNENDNGDDNTLVIDNTVAGEGNMSMIHASSLMQHKAADAIEGLQALAGQAGFIIEEEVQGSEKQQTIVIEQQEGEVLNSSGTTLADGSIIISADQAIVEEQIAIDETTSEQITQIVESEEALEVGSGLTSLELTEEQLSSLQHGDMIQIEGQVYLVELTQDPESPDKQLLSFLPVTQG